MLRASHRFVNYRITNFRVLLSIDINGMNKYLNLAFIHDFSYVGYQFITITGLFIMRYTVFKLIF